MQIGRLRHRLMLQSRTPVQDAAGAISYTWSDVAAVWGEVRTPAGIERFAPEVDQVRATLTHTVRIRSGVATVTPAMRFLWGTRKLQIVSITDPDNRGESQVLLCNELVEA